MSRVASAVTPVLVDSTKVSGRNAAGEPAWLPLTRNA
jgi:hypothetical protein